MRLVGNDKQPLDMSQDAHVEAFKNSMAKWGQEMAENKDGSKYGFPDIEGVDLQPYGTPYET